LIETSATPNGESILFLGAGRETWSGAIRNALSWTQWGRQIPPCCACIMGLEQPDEWAPPTGGSTNVAGRLFFEQKPGEALDTGPNGDRHPVRAMPGWTQTQVRSCCGSFCFSTRRLFKEVGKTQRMARKHGLALALMLPSPLQLLVLR